MAPQITIEEQTASDLGREIAARRLDPVELCEAYLERIRAHPLSDRIYVHVMEARARAEARAAAERAKHGTRRHLLDGVPLSWKDLFDTADAPTEAGSALLRGRLPDTDAEVLQAAAMQGAVTLGKTHMSELAFSGLGLNPVTQTSPCVHDARAVSGGSSSGAAASVAFGLAPGAIGSDTGGSVRIPAAWNDLVGLKTTLGQISTKGTVPLSRQFDTIGPLTQSVEDAAQIYALLRGEKPIWEAASGAERADLSRLCLGVPSFAAQELEPEPEAAFEAGCAALRACGATITPIDFPEIPEAFALSTCLYTAEAYAEWGEEIEAAPERVFEGVRARFLAGAAFSAAEYLRAWWRLEALRKSFIARMRSVDALLMPSVPILPPKIDALLADPAYYTERNLLTLRNTRIANLMGLCAITLPTPTASCGLMLNALPLGEKLLLKQAAAIEKTLKPL